jgi:putative membrane protein
MVLTEAGQQEVAGRAREVEQRTGAQVVVAVLERARTYPEATWRGFSCGAALGAAAAVGLVLAGPRWPAASDAFWTVALSLGAGFLAALLARALPALTLALVAPAARAQATRERARALFVDEGVHRTRDRIGVLMLVSLLERRVELVPDAGLTGRVPAPAWEAVLAAMRPGLSGRRTAEACAAGLASLEQALAAAGLAPAGGAGNELPRELVVEPGGRP